MRTRWVFLMIFVLQMLLVGVKSVPGQWADMILADPAFGKLQRPAVPFNHHQHMKALGDASCQGCHHSLVKGDALSIGGEIQQCSDCHRLKAEGKKLSLMRAYHKKCQGCHREKRLRMKLSGQLTCGGCHPKEP